MLTAIEKSEFRHLATKVTNNVALNAVEQTRLAELNVKIDSHYSLSDDEFIANSRHSASNQHSIPDNVRRRIGRDGGTIEQGPVNAEFFGGNHDAGRGQVTDLAAVGWFKSAAGVAYNNAEHQAMLSMGFSPAANSITLQIPSRDAYCPALPKSPFNSMSGLDGTKGGYTIGSTFLNNLEIAETMFAGPLQFATKIVTATGEDLFLATIDDTAGEGSQIGENTAAGDAEFTFGGRQFSAYKFTSGIAKVPNELLIDNRVQLAQKIPFLLGQRIGRTLNTKFTTGTGGATCQGFMTAATLGVTAASATAITADEIINLIHSVDPAYRSEMADQVIGFAMTDATWKYISLLKDGDGNYLIGSLANATEPRLRGYRVFICTAMDTISASSKPIAFGCLNKFTVRQAGQVRIMKLVERYAEADQTAFIVWERHDSALIDAGTHPIKYLQMHS